MCQSRADGGTRCAASTKLGVAKASQTYTRAVLAAAESDKQVAAAEEAVAARLGCDVFAVPADDMDLDPGVVAARDARYAADNEVMRARREHDDAMVEHACTPTGRTEVLAALDTAHAKGDLRKAARIQHVLMRSDDMVAQRAGLCASEPDRRRTRVYG